ncbi:MAG: cell division protein FtsL [Paludibacteraceae bacterium]|nr:cell division protein FtsL [Paludibacteraceae bacterium]MDD6356718.1 cell division protein FtsL [Bacteroidales bacterium]
MLIFIFGFLESPLFAKIQNPEIDNLLKPLDAEIAKRDYYQNQKQNTIDSLKNLLSECTTQTQKYECLKQLSDEYGSFVYDSAWIYTRKMYQMADSIAIESYRIEAKLKMSFVLISSGLYTEAKSLLTTINVNECTEEQKLEYYANMTRLNFDLRDYVKDEYFSEYYEKEGVAMQDSVVKYQKDPNQKDIVIGQKEMRSGNADLAIGYFEKALSNPEISDKDVALVTSCLGYLYSNKGNDMEAVRMLVKASLCDIKTVTKETVALRNLANKLRNYDELDRANDYIRIADEDAKFYNARQRMAEIGNVYTDIQQERMKLIEEQRNNYIRFFIVMFLLVIIAAVLLVIIVKQYRKLNETKDLILKNNQDLQRTNNKLQESNKIKEEYIGYFFRMNSDFIQKQENLQKRVTKLLNNKDFEKLKNVVSEDDLKEQRADLYKNFDKMFLKIFPTFVEEYNALFAEKDRVSLLAADALDTDLRIFALIRLGIKDNVDIAEFLGFSVNTIYTYKTRIKNKSIVDNDEFEKKIMKIKAV